MSDTATKKALGQFFTPASVAQLMLGLSRQDKSSVVLEPSAGQGVFLDALSTKGYSDVTAYELDEKVIPEKHRSQVINKSFVGAEFTRPVSLVIGNPPYVRWKNMTPSQQKELKGDPLWAGKFNNLCDLLFYFIARGIEIVETGGELIFITPSFWMNTLHAKNLRSLILEQGHIDLLVRFGEAQVFPGVGSSIIIFRFVKEQKGTSYIDVYDYVGEKTVSIPNSKSSLETLQESGLFAHSLHPHPENNQPWSFPDAEAKQELEKLETACTRAGELQTLGSIAEIANGMVSGLDKAFRQPDDLKVKAAATIRVVKARDMDFLHNNSESRYLWLQDVTNEKQLKETYPTVHQHLQPYVKRLNNRYDYGKGTKYWQWSFLRSLSLFKQKQRKIFIPCKERISNKDRLRLVVVDKDVFPTQDVTAIVPFSNIRETPEYITGLLSSKPWYQWVTQKGLVKGKVAEFSEAPLSQIPVRLIDWNNADEVSAHDKIVTLVQNYKGDYLQLEELDQLVAGLMAPKK